MSSLISELSSLLQKLESKTSTPEPDFPYYVKHKVYGTTLLMTGPDKGYILKPGNSDFAPGDEFRTEEQLYSHPDSIIITEQQAKESMTQEEVLAGIKNVSQDMPQELRKEVKKLVERISGNNTTEEEEDTPDWTDQSQPKYYVYLDHTTDQLTVGTSYTMQTVNTEYTLDKEYLETLLIEKNAERETKH